MTLVTGLRMNGLVVLAEVGKRTDLAARTASDADLPPETDQVDVQTEMGRVGD